MSVSLDLDLVIHSNQRCQATFGQELPTGLGSDCLTDSGDLRSLAQIKTWSLHSGREGEKLSGADSKARSVFDTMTCDAAKALY